MNTLQDLEHVFGPIVYQLRSAPEPVQTLFYYITGWILVHSEKASLVSVDKVEGRIQFLMELRDGTRFRVTKPVLTNAEEQILRQELAESTPSMVLDHLG